jgi:pilus assembly protein CpaB
MNRRLMTILLCAFVVAAGASYVVYRLVRQQVGGGAGRRVNVVVAAGDLPLGTLIKATDLKTAAVVGDAPKDAVLKPELAIGRGVISTIYAGEPLSEKRLAVAGSGGGLAATIPPGMRACAVKVDDVVGVAGFVVPGMRVDVLISGNPPGTDTSGGSKVKTLLQNIEVLSAGANFQRDAEGKPVNVPVVNLLVTPEQAEILSLTSNNQTHIQLALRNPIDRQETKTPGTEMASLFGAPPAPRAPVRAAAVPMARVARPVTAVPKAEKPAPPTFVVQVINGDKTVEHKYPAQGDRQ